ncbi:WGR domain-containing protein [Tundrisphaera sp. TA3]|uniref:WGR domain-containing protein n=1 Tax=Tundrisphaera sp. TA3 TaxID=3435775 RepID=UPI003EBBF20C
MKELTEDQRAKFEELRQAIAKQEPVYAAAIDAYNSKVKAALEELNQASRPFFSLLNQANRLHSDIESAIREAAEEAEEDGRDDEAARLEEWAEAWEEIGGGLVITNADEPRKMKPRKPPISKIIAKLPLRPEGVEVQPAGDRSIDPKVRASVESSWRRIDAWLKNNAPTLAAKMHPGATPEAIAEAERALALELPEAVRASYLIHDGSGVMRLFPSGDYLSLEQMQGEVRMWKEILAETEFDEPDMEPVGPIQHVHFHPHWIPLTNSGGGDYTVIDLAPAEGGKVGQLVNFSHETGPENLAAAGLAAYLAYLADGLEGGAATIGEDTYLIWNDERDTPRSGYVLPAGASAPASTSDGASGKRYFEFTSEGSGKFWEVACEGSEMTTRWGKLGSNGQAKTKTFDSPEKAAAETAKIIAQKVKEGYVEKSR